MNISNRPFHFVTSIVIFGLALGSIAYWLMDINSNRDYPITSISQSFLVTAQTDTDNFSNVNKSSNDRTANTQQNDTTLVKAYGHFANNQIQDGIVTWIEGGIWNLDIVKASNNNTMTSNMTAGFTANFTMIKPDGSLSHSHVINNFKSDDIIFAGKDIVVLGIADIHSDNGTEYSKVPITIHLMGKKVLGLMIDVTKTDSHFAGSSEMYGTLISGVGLDNSTTSVGSSSLTKENSMSLESNNTYRTNPNSMAHMAH